MSITPDASRFPTTCWSRIIASRERGSPEARQAFATLCASYWYPLYSFIRRKGRSPEHAMDLTQDYFARLIENGTVDAADPRRGRFRTFLLADCTRFLASQVAHDLAAKRGGGRVPLSIDARDAEGRYLREPSHDLTPEKLFDRDWGLVLLETVLARLGEEYRASGRTSVFEALKVVLTEPPRSVALAEIAARLGVTENAAQVAVHRLRRRYRELVRDEISAYVAEPADVDDEIKDLFAALAS